VHINKKYVMYSSFTQRETSSEAIYTVLFQRVAGTTPLVNCSTVTGQKSKSTHHLGMICGLYKAC